ncbi:type II secretion system F family protein [Candidatus Wolfebacteria bacterium]|nr:type II secretion system F family protein [Candidatus Wolfebacteria bacterium]
MALFTYKAIDETGREVEGTIEAVSEDVAISGVQRRGLVIVSLEPADKVPFFERNLASLRGVSNRDIVILSRQISTLFQAQVSALKVFNMLAEETENEKLRKALGEVATALQGGSSISKALEGHPKVFSPFYVSMVRVGEETGQLEEIFGHLADYLDRTYEVTSKARNALIYPTFVVVTFIAVMVLMLTTVIPKLSVIIADSGQDIPIYTKAVIGLSDFFVHYGVLLLVLVIIGAFFLWRHSRTERGKINLARLRIELPYLGSLYRKLYLSRIADNMHTMLTAGIPMVRALEDTSLVVGNILYEKILKDATVAIRGGSTVADAMSGYDEIPGIMVQMVRIGEETGELGNILNTLATFYRREVSNAVDTLVDLIEPVMIVLLGLGVGTLLASVLIPIYNISSSF